MPRKGRGAARANSNRGRAVKRGLPADMEDEVDQFMAGRDKVALDADSDSEPSDMDEEEAVFDMQGGTSDSEQEADDADGVQDSDDDDEEEEEGGDGDAAATADWGKRRKAFYNQETAALENEFDEDMARDEEEEAVRMQKRGFEGMQQDDFAAFSDDSEAEGEEEEEAGASAAAEEGSEAESEQELGARVAGAVRPKTARKGSAKRQASKSAQNGAALLGLGVPALGGAHVEAVRRDGSKLTSKERLELIAKESPELLGLLQEFRGGVDALSSQLVPLLRRSHELPTGKGVTYLETKFHLLLTYCINIAFFLLLKAEGQQVRDHPVIDQLVEIRTVLEKLRPLDKKLQYQIDKLVKLAATGAASEATEAAQDPLRFKPRPDRMVTAAGAAAEASLEEGDLAYRVNKLSAMHFDEDERAAEAKERREEKRQRRMGKSRLLQDLREEFADAPEVIQEAVSGDAAFDAREEARRKFEEEHFVRLMDTREDKALRKRAQRRLERSDPLADLTDFGALEELVADDAEVEEEPAARRRSLAQFLNQLEQKRSGRTKLASGDQDVALRDEEAAARKRRRVPEPGEDDGMGDFFGQGGGLEGGDSDGAEDDMYEAAREAKRARKAERSAKFAPKPVLPPKPEVVTGPRKASSQILQNRGLVPSRNKLSRNPRKKKRVQHEKMVNRRKGQVREVREGAGGRYSGEQTGIKANVTHSTRFK